MIDIEGMMIADGFDEAIIGYCYDMAAGEDRVIYSFNKCIDILKHDMSEEEAWKMITINPAKLLHIDDRVGSIKEGKDADLVLWSDHPLSVYAKAEKTMIEGTVYFDIEQDKLKRKAIQQERNELMKMMLAEKSGGGKTKPPKRKENRNLECETIK